MWEGCVFHSFCFRMFRLCVSVCMCMLLCVSVCVVCVYVC